VSSPTEPGNPHTGDRPEAANGSVPPAEPAAKASAPGRRAPAPGQIADPGDVPPWQRGLRKPPAAPEVARTEVIRPEAGRAEPPRPTAADRRPEPRPAGEPRPEPRAGEPRPEPRAEARPEARADARTEAYPSELPDLSAPASRAPQRGSAAAGTRPAAAAGRIQVAQRPRGPVRASMQIRRVDPWSVLKVSLVLSAALFFVWMIAVAFLYLVLGGMGVWSKLNSNVGDLLTSASGTTGGELVSAGTIFGGAALVGLINIVLLSAMATVGAFIYNLTTDLVGGVEVTLADRD